jgi:hypothetical protein
MTYEVATGNVTMGNLFASGIEIGTSPSISAASSSLELTGSGFAAPTVALISHFANAATGNMLAFAKGRGTPATPAIVAENDVLGQITAYGARTSTSYAQMAQISFEADGAITTSSMPGRIVFSVTNSGSLTPTEAMRINRDGSVTFAQGVGVQGPANFAQGVGVQGPANFGGFFSATNDVFLSGSTTISGRFTHGYFVYGQLKLNGVLPTTTVNNQALTAVTQLWRLTGAGGGTWTGLTGGTDGLVVTIVNAGTGNLTLAHENTGSTAGNRFVLPGNASYVVGPNDSVTIYYDGTSARWRVLR